MNAMGPYCSLVGLAPQVLNLVRIRPMNSLIVSALLKLKLTDQVVILDGRIEQLDSGASQNEPFAISLETKAACPRVDIDRFTLEVLFNRIGANQIL
jgi:hypothetical protein